jgi:hypothetical protein
MQRQGVWGFSDKEVQYKKVDLSFFIIDAGIVSSGR